MNDNVKRTTKKLGDKISLEWHRRIGQDTTLSLTAKAVARGLFAFANPDGSSVRPGRKLLAQDVGLAGPRHVSKHLHTLMDAGYIYRVFEGTATNGLADEFHLVFPEWGFGAGTDNDQLAVIRANKAAVQSTKGYEPPSEPPQDFGDEEPLEDFDTEGVGSQSPYPWGLYDPRGGVTESHHLSTTPIHHTDSDSASPRRPCAAAHGDKNTHHAHDHDAITDIERVERATEELAGVDADGLEPELYRVIQGLVDRGDKTPTAIARMVANMHKQMTEAA